MQTQSPDIELPYPPSWIDRLIEWIDGWPGPAWVDYLVATLATAVLINGAFWIDGSEPVGAFDPFNTSFAILVVYWPVLYRYLTRVGSRALRAFRPLLEVDEARFVQIDYQLATLPRSVGWLTIPLGIVLAVLTGLGDPEPFGEIVPSTPLPFVGDLLMTGFLAAAFFCLLFRSIRQLQMVGSLHRQATNIDLLDLGPAHSFSELTARTGIGVILIMVVAYAADPLAFGSAFDVLLSAATILSAIAIFVLPIMGIQSRIEDEKGRALHQVNALLQSATDRLHDQVSRGNYDEGPKLNDTLAALVRERELIRSVSTWPWNPRTVRGFASALLLPIFLWLVTRLLENLF